MYLSSFILIYLTCYFWLSRSGSIYLPTQEGFEHKRIPNSNPTDLHCILITDVSDVDSCKETVKHCILCWYYIKVYIKIINICWSYLLSYTDRSSKATSPQSPVQEEYDRDIVSPWELPEEIHRILYSSRNSIFSEVYNTAYESVLGSLAGDDDCRHV